MLPSRDSGCKVTVFSFIHKELRYFFSFSVSFVGLGQWINLREPNIGIFTIMPRGEE